MDSKGLGGQNAFSDERHQIPLCCKGVLTRGYCLRISSEIWITFKPVPGDKVKTLERAIWTVLKWLMGRGDGESFQEAYF